MIKENDFLPLFIFINPLNVIYEIKLHWNIVEYNINFHETSLYEEQDDTYFNTTSYKRLPVNISRTHK